MKQWILWKWHKWTTGHHCYHRTYFDKVWHCNVCAKEFRP